MRTPETSSRRAALGAHATQFLPPAFREAKKGSRHHGATWGSRGREEWIGSRWFEGTSTGLKMFDTMFAANPRFARGESCISFDMLKSLRRI
jgi:hypothetical protein